VAWIKKQIEKNAAIAHTNIKNSREVCKFEVTRGWGDPFVSHHSAESTEKKSSPQEEPCLQVAQVFLDQTMCNMHEAVQGCPVARAFNFDELEISDWED
jgi:hypothetical protein